MNALYQNMQTTGTIFNYDDTGKRKIEWEGNSDGINGTIKVNVDDNGKKISETIKLNHDELEELFNQRMDFMPLHSRLIRDFMSDQRDYKSPFKNIQDSINVNKKRLNKNKTKNKKNKNKNKSKKNIIY